MTVERDDALLLQAGVLRYLSLRTQAWSLLVEDLILVGEWTNDHGPADDYYYLFVGRHPTEIFEAPMYANPQLPEDLSETIGAPIESGLAACTTFNSRVMWPVELAGRPMFSYSAARRGPGMLNRVWDKVMPLIHSEFTQEVRQFVEARRAG